MGKLEVKNVCIDYEAKSVVKDCSFEVNAGEVVVILGASGVGKTSLLKAVGGFVPLSNGAIHFDSEPVVGPDEQLVPGHALVKLINQDFALDDFHSVEENLRLKLLPYDDDYKNERINTLLRLIKLTPIRDMKASDLSGGQRQRLAIARALADEPEFVLLDEPFNQLDYQTKSRIGQHIKRYLKQNKIGAIMVTHNGIEAMDWADRILFMSDGKILRSDTPKNFYETPSDPQEASFFGIVNKVQLTDEAIYFRPASFKKVPEGDFNIKLELEFTESQFLGWYSAYQFMVNNSGLEENNRRSQITLHAQHDISGLAEIFVKKIIFSD